MMTAALIAVWAKEFGTRIAVAVWDSFVAFFKSQAVWLAGGCLLVAGIFVGGFWVGHIKGKEVARSRVPAAFAGMAPASADFTAYEKRADAAEAEAKQWKAEAATKQEAVLKLTAELAAKSDALAVMQKKLAAKVPVPRKPAPAPAKAAWTPFER